MLLKTQYLHLEPADSSLRFWVGVASRLIRYNPRYYLSLCFQGLRDAYVMKMLRGLNSENHMVWNGEIDFSLGIQTFCLPPDCHHRWWLFVCILQNGMIIFATGLHDPHSIFSSERFWLLPGRIGVLQSVWDQPMPIRADSCLVCPLVHRVIENNLADTGPTLKRRTWILMFPKCINETQNPKEWKLINTILHSQRPSKVMSSGWKHKLSINHKTQVALTNGSVKVFPKNPKSKALVDFWVVQMMMFS